MVSVVPSIKCCFLFLQLLFSAKSVLDNPINDNPWDINGPCQQYVERLAVAQSNMVQCATNWSIPPRVCTNCFQQYIAFKQLEYETRHANNVTSLDNRTCTQVIYDNYLLSYSYDISDALSSSIWAKSRCDSCLTITWNYTANDSQVEFSNQTLVFQDKLFNWRDCVVNYTEYIGEHNKTICNYCKLQFNDLFNYYWNIYVEPNIDFCVDVETTMNDTFHLWNDVWACAERKDRKRDLAMVVITVSVLSIITILFYASSYIQGGGQTPRIFIKYSRVIPGVQRSRLLSSSTSNNNLPAYVYTNTTSSS
ncbi:hypothetical protein DICVIV_02425 [Dictyocaulus viviparus]|uniref:Osteopetrosis-associated transmembrane protein 1 n=1 Tax=Dictyocaulus viviparus TaxID=29172 RepID=A0A0D8YA14_DICVI|nr:hypothetical protein DICVIV_02425 [Dictyocaulus viviparus]